MPNITFQRFIKYENRLEIFYSSDNLLKLKFFVNLKFSQIPTKKPSNLNTYIICTYMCVMIVKYFETPSS